MNRFSSTEIERKLFFIFFAGLKDSKNPCCITWANGTSGCIPLLNPCPHAYKHFFWDAYHLTEAACSVIATRCINDTSICTPFNIKELAQI